VGRRGSQAAVFMDFLRQKVQRNSSRRARGVRRGNSNRYYGVVVLWYCGL